jgi:hypothetical protein
LAEAFRPFWREALFGLAVQLIVATWMLYAANVFALPDFNDMGELVFLGVQNLFSGINPYGKTYTVGIAATGLRYYYDLPGFSYGPVTLIAHLPVMLLPVRWDGLGKADVMPSFFALQVFFTFLFFSFLARAGHARFGLLFWGNPLWVPTEANTFFALPLLFVLLGLLRVEQPRASVLWLSLATATYQLAAPFLVFALIYHRKSVLAVLQGLAPAALLVGLFVIWSALEGHPLQLLQDMLLSQLNRQYQNWSYLHFVPIWQVVSSVPVLAFNVFHVDYVSVWTGGALRLSSLMMLATLVVMVILCALLLRRPSARKILTYGSLVVFLFIASMPGGVGEHYVILAVPAFLVLVGTDWWPRFLAGFKARVRLAAARLRAKGAAPQSVLPS